VDTVRAPALLRLADRESITEEIERLIASTLVYHESCKLSIRQEESARKLRRSVQKATETCSRMAFAHAGTMEAQDHGVSKKLFWVIEVYLQESTLLARDSFFAASEYQQGLVLPLDISDAPRMSHPPDLRPRDVVAATGR